MKRLFSPEPEFLNLISEILAKQPKVMVQRPNLVIAMDFLKDLMKYIRSRENVVATVGGVLSTEILQRIIGTAENNG